VRPDIALDVRETSHASAGMLAYVRALRTWLPRVAADLTIVDVGSGDNFDLAEQVGLPLALARLRPRAVHFPTPYVPRFVPVPHIVTVHDVIDLEFPQFAKAKVGPYWRYVVGPVLRSARAVITDDDVTVGLLTRYLRVDPTRVHVIPLGVDAPDALPAPVVRARPYAFYAGNHRPHKDLATLVRAWTALPPGVPLDLVVTGDADLGDGATRGEDGVLVFAGDCSADEVWALHRGAAVYVHPALREGFGLPMLEALRAGTLVIASDDAAPRVLRDVLKLYPAGNAPALTAQLTAAIAMTPEERRDTIDRAQRATVHLTWQRTAALTAGVYRDVLG
jgi:glycosyltransferase involved in cell wall biosynthesis